MTGMTELITETLVRLFEITQIQDETITDRFFCARDFVLETVARSVIMSIDYQPTPPDTIKHCSRQPIPG